MMRVLIWATHLQTDILAVARHLDRRDDIELLIVVPDVPAFLRTPFAKACRLWAPLLDRHDPATARRVQDFKADVAVADNHIPPRGSAPRLLYMWHGLGWKARSRLDLDVFYRQVRQLIGTDPRQPTPNFLAQCYGPTDLDWRVHNWKLPRAACVPVGMAFSDLLLMPPYAKADFASDYKIDIMRRKTVLLAITWHYGGIFTNAPGIRRTLGGLFGRLPCEVNDASFLERLVQDVERRGANLLICLHDRHRYDSAFIAMVEGLAERYDFVEIRFKNEHPDNLTDLLVADVMLSNLSSFLSYYYVLGRPALHILPAAADDARIERTIMFLSRFRLRLRVSSADAWMLDPRDVGGAIVTDADQAIAELEKALKIPAQGAAATRRWLQRLVPAIDGKACGRIERQLWKLCGRPLDSHLYGGGSDGAQAICGPDWTRGSDEMFTGTGGRHQVLG